MGTSLAKKITQLLKLGDRGLLYFSIACTVTILFNLGYNKNIETVLFVDHILRYLFYLFGALHLARLILITLLYKKRRLIHYGEIIISIYFFFVIILSIFGFKNLGINFFQSEWLYLGFFATLLIEVSKVSLFFDDFYFNPTLLFVISFLLLILVGTLLLILPNSTTDNQISFVDALFTSTSAVCVTGLTVFDVSAKFTQFGQTIILILFQLGGLGIMTFTGFFGFFFTGGFSYKNRLMYTELINENKIGSVINTLSRIVYITLLFEIIGAAFIFFNIPDNTFISTGEAVYFSIFHAVSAFCNAGFSTIHDGLYNPLFKTNYNIHLVISVLIIFGGLGFNILMNTYYYLKRWSVNIYRKLRYDERFIYQAQELQFSSKIILYTTFILLTSGTILFFILEYNNSLQEHDSLWGKMVSSFFLSVTPRSAGFTTVSMENITFPSIMLLFFFMWIGASPGSNGGGIKTTTFAISFLNIFSIARGKENLELFKRRVTKETSIRALAVIILSVLIYGIILFLLSLTDGNHDYKALAFESMSAFAISGLSLGITPTLSEGGKIILVFAMFIGRIGALTLLIAFIKDTKIKAYKYPSDTVQL